MSKPHLSHTAADLKQVGQISLIWPIVTTFFSIRLIQTAGEKHLLGRGVFGAYVVG